MNKFFIKNKNNIYEKRGFTLIELMVATSIFMMIMLMAMGSIVVASNASKKAQKVRSTMDNVNFALESMTRSIRMGINYTCQVNDSFAPNANTGDCQSGGNSFSFSSLDTGGTISFIREKRGDETYSLSRCEDSVCVPIVSSEVDIERLKFFVKGSSKTDQIQPSVYIIIKGSIIYKGEKTSFAIQTMASQRNIEQSE